MSDRSTGQPLRIGILGCGKVVEKYHLPALKRSKAWRLGAACDPSAERRRWLQGAVPGVPVFERSADLLAAPLDAALIATPPATHAELAIEALEAGLHVLVEKPMALSLADAHRMVAAANASGRLLLVGFNRRFHPAYLQLRGQLHRLEPGQLRSVSSNFVFDAGAWGLHMGNEAAGGDVLDDVVCHQADLLSWLLGRQVVRVAATCSPGTGAAEIRYELDFCDGLVARCTAGHGTKHREEIAVGLDDKTLVARPGMPLEAAGSGPLRLWREVESFANQIVRKLAGMPSPRLESFQGQLEAFASGVQSGVPHPESADAASGIYSVSLVQAVRKSLQGGGIWQEIASTEKDA